jgi:hypothetical protein
MGWRAHNPDAVLLPAAPARTHCTESSPQQKYSQQRELQRQLRRFIITGADFHALLLHLLRELVREERNNMRLLGHLGDDIRVPLRCAV